MKSPGAEKLRGIWQAQSPKGHPFRRQMLTKGSAM